MAAPRAAAPAASAALLALGEAVHAAAASARAAGRVPEASAVVAIGRSLRAIGFQLAEPDACRTVSAVEEELTAREQAGRPALRARVQAGHQRVPAQVSGAIRAARNLAQHAHFGKGADCLLDLCCAPQKAQRGGRRRHRVPSDDGRTEPESEEFRSSGEALPAAGGCDAIGWIDDGLSSSSRCRFANFGFRFQYAGKDGLARRAVPENEGGRRPP